MLGKLILYSAGAAVVVIVGMGALMFTGDKPAPCVNRPLTASPNGGRLFKNKWNQFRNTAKSQPASLNVSEQEATDLVSYSLERFDIPMDDVQVHFCPDNYVEGIATYSGLGQESYARGRVNITVNSDGSVDAEFLEMKFGNLPTGVVDSITNMMMNGYEKILNKDLGVRFTGVTVLDGSALVQGGP